jgi:hypothetical protein
VGVFVWHYVVVSSPPGRPATGLGWLTGGAIA